MLRTRTQTQRLLISFRPLRLLVAEWPWHKTGLGAILALSAFLEFFRLNQEGFGNQYYAAAVKSMLMNWHNFFFVSFDPGGFVSVDKPPLGFWIQAASAKLFGFSGLSLLLPEALAAVASVALLYYLVRRAFGPIAGLIAAFALAVMPISVATARNNTIDSLLVLTLLGAAWAITRAVEKKERTLLWLVLATALVGIGFNIKMLEAFLPLPAFYLLYLLAARVSVKRRVLNLALATVVLLGVSVPWVAAVDLTPPDQRPYVGSSADNSELNLVLGYNGLDRVLRGVAIFGRGRTTSDQPQSSQATRPPAGSNSGYTLPNGGTFPGGAGETGTAGVLRLLNPQLAGQIGWLLVLAVLGLAVAVWRYRPRLRLPWMRQKQEVSADADDGTARGWSDPRWQGTLLWGAWLVVVGIFFSYTSMFHTYYMVTFAPAIAAMVGIGITALWQHYWHGTSPRSWRGWFLPLALLVGAGVEVYILRQYPAESRWLVPVLVGLVSLAAVGLAISIIWMRAHTRRVVGWLTIVGMAALLLAPMAWSGITVANASGASLPSAGPRTNDGFARSFQGQTGDQADRTGRALPAGGANSARGAFGGEGAVNNSKLISYLVAHQGNSKFLVAVPNAGSAEGIILATGKPVMALGGFIGNDPILTVDKLAQLAANGTVRYFLVPGSGFGRGFGGGGSSALISWIQQNCQTVPSSQWQSSSSAAGFGFGGETLYYYAGNGAQ